MRDSFDTLEKMRAVCAEKGFHETENIEKIARAKEMMFGTTEWYRCPCDGQNADRYCISDLCVRDIQTKGVCHCNCYKR